MAASNYTDDSIRTLEWNEHIRERPGMYIGKLGDGQSPDDGIYVLVKEIIDNSIDEFVMGAGKKVIIDIEDHFARIRDFGRGIPLGKVIDCVSKINTGGKYDSDAFQKSVGMNGVGTKAVNALSTKFIVKSFRDGRCKEAEFSKGVLVREEKECNTTEKNGTEIYFEPDANIFKNFRFLPAYMEEKVWNYAYLNNGLSLIMNGKTYVSPNGLLDLLQKHVDDSIRYPVAHFKQNDIEIAFTHGNQYGEHYYSFVNGQYTTQGGTHQQAFREGIVKGARDFFKKDLDPSDVRNCIIGAISVRIQEPVFESQTKTKLGSTTTAPGGAQLRTWIVDYVSREMDNYLHKNPETAKALQDRITQNERERKEIAGIKKLANERAKKANLHNRKLRDCKIHLTDVKNPLNKESMIFITEGDSASGSITKARNVQTQAVFSLRGKPLNSFGLTKKVVYENEEFNLLQSALDIENGLEDLRYDKVIIATDADVDGMHIRLLLMTFFLQFFPELVEQKHLFILQTPLFRVRNKQVTKYCYDEVERDKAAKEIGKTGLEITRFKGLGEISPEEFGQFIGEDMRLETVILPPDANFSKMLAYYMGANTPQRQDHIVANLRAEAVEEL
ncbi:MULTISPECIES: DNA topoisomerase IV subunit B [unclassified Fibrobacter]|uniref:DNA topoisomerase IV subunit B n=1 Tax=unclassified Fibrobacter TaxID=2634177 RepID=UPI000D6C7111|nr:MULTISPECIES: DNA topoisomerase IV subunit B [unclassified Fibrobacter]PWJ64440.1 topoisomerase-4 subunit B [Fibrobacter sp. UWR4]PZW69317.1 topoisomerase-4 subunit B [Fibrobacter sp. UWR1]